MVDNARELEPEWVAGKQRVGVTAGASAPEVLVQEVIERLQGAGRRRACETGRHHREGGVSLPRELVRRP